MKAQELEVGQALLESIRKVQGGKFQLQVAERYRANNGGDILQDLNDDDERFQQNAGRARRAWITVSEKNARAVLDANGSDIALPEEENATTEVGIGDPVHKDGKTKLRVQVRETVFPRDEYQAQDPEASAKRAGREGPCLKYKATEEDAERDSRLKAGELYYIFSNTSVVAEDAKQDVFLQHEADPSIQSSSAGGPISASETTVSEESTSDLG